MKIQIKLLFLQIYTFLICNNFVSISSVSISNSNETNGLSAERGNERILSRRRRYLIFPKGTSLQLVMDTYHPVVDHTNLLYCGITTALAWELPSEPVYLDKMLQEAYENGTLPLIDRSDDISNNTLQELNVDTKKPPVVDYYYSNPKTNVPAYSPPIYSSTQRTLDSYYTDRKIVDRYYTNPIRVNYKPVAPNKPKQPLTKTISNKLDYYFSYADKLLNDITNLSSKKPKTWNTADWSTDNSYSSKPFDSNIYTAPISGNRRFDDNSNKNYYQGKAKHFIHPLFRKRSADNNFSAGDLTKEEELNLNFHRSSRQNLYKRITKFIEAYGMDGHECVLRALCETGQRRKDNKPGPFLIEILRAIFSMPKSVSNEIDPLHNKYDLAHESNEDCEDKYPNCYRSFWKSDFKY